MAASGVHFRLPPISANDRGRSPRAVTVATADDGGSATISRPRRPTALETRISLVSAISSQAFSRSQRIIGEILTEVVKYATPSRKFGDPRSLEEALMSVPDLETVDFKVLKRTNNYEIREVKPFFVAETTMTGKSGFDFSSSGQAFNVLADYLFGKNAAGEQMEMTTPVLTSKEMTNPVITTKSGEEGTWQMSFVLPSKYGENLPRPDNQSLRIRQVPGKIVAVAVFSGWVTDELVQEKEQRLRESLTGVRDFKVKECTSVEVAQFNPPFTPPFARRNEISLEVEKS